MEDKLIAYHATRLNLIQYIDAHLKSIAEVNVYNNGWKKDMPVNTIEDYELTNESMGKYLMIRLKEKLIEKDGQREIHRTLK